MQNLKILMVQRTGVTMNSTARLSLSYAPCTARAPTLPRLCAVRCMQVQRVGVTTLPTVLLTLIIAMAVLAWGAHQQGPGQLSRAVASGTGKAPSRRLRSTEYAD